MYLLVLGLSNPLVTYVRTHATRITGRVTRSAFSLSRFIAIRIIGSRGRQYGIAFKSSNDTSLRASHDSDVFGYDLHLNNIMQGLYSCDNYDITDNDASVARCRNCIVTVLY